MRTKAFISLVLSLLLIQSSAISQETAKSPKPGFFVLHQNKILLQNQSKYNALLDSLFAPVLNDLVKEGKLISWGQLDHAWGDEWNVNFFFITENHKAFLDFWSEYISRVNKRFPGWQEKVIPLFMEHKDNMYSIRTMR